MAIYQSSLLPEYSKVFRHNSFPVHFHKSPFRFSYVTRFLYYALDFMNGGDLFRHWRKHRNRRTEMAPFYASEVPLSQLSYS